jgi:phage terminase small subunit
MALTPKQQKFVTEYLIDLNGTQAAIRAGYSAKTANEQASRLLTNVSVAQALAEAQAKLSERSEITAEMVMRELWAIGTADPNELIEYRRGCCRYCWGKGFRFQRTDAEMREARTTFDRDHDDELGGEFDMQGGVGFDPRKDPNPDCPECHGEGQGQAIIKDTRKLTGPVRKLYAGVKITKEGLEVKMHDKVAALTLAGRHLGMFKDKLEHSGDPNAPLAITVVRFSDLPKPG